MSNLQYLDIKLLSEGFRQEILTSSYFADGPWRDGLSNNTKPADTLRRPVDGAGHGAREVSGVILAPQHHGYRESLARTGQTEGCSVYRGGSGLRGRSGGPGYPQSTA